MDRARQRLFRRALSSEQEHFRATPLFIHLAQGLALTVGSALGNHPPSTSACLATYTLPNRAGLTAGARAWTKHAHRSQTLRPSELTKRDKGAAGWWGTPQGSVTTLNERANDLFWKIINNATWRNLHWLPHEVLVYEVRVEEGYGMRWSQDQSAKKEGEAGEDEERPWIFRGFLEPMIENGHELGWRHPLQSS